MHSLLSQFARSLRMSVACDCTRHTVPALPVAMGPVT
jgi:hypothetical protein